ncbi:MAG: hypothetical protein ACXWXO_20495 [Nocardioides sp.]
MITDPGGNDCDDGLPYVDEHRVRIAAPPRVVWAALQRYVASSLTLPRRSPLRRALGTVPVAGFEVSGRVPEERLTLTGRHRFSRYRLELVLADGGDGTTELRALTYAVFPGLRGRAYRALVIGSRAHVVAMTHLLRSIRRLSR